MSTREALTLLTVGLDESERDRAGGKAVGLAALLRAGLPVPDTWVVRVGAEPTAEELSRLAEYSPRWAVRSSATVEDGAALSYAGMFSTELDVPVDGVAAAIESVRSWGSNGRVAAYRDRAGAGTHGVEVAVLLQPYRPPSRSGLWLGRDLDGGRLEWTDGAGERLVSGAVIPNWEEWTSTGRIHGSAPEVFTVGGTAVGAACLAAQRALGAPADLELAVVDGELLWLQFRPVTVAPGANAVPRVGSDERLVRGTPASSGQAIGPALRPDGAFDPRWEPGMVLLAESTDPDWTPLMAEAAAMVTAYGGMLCHTAIVARELGIPCVTGVGEAALAYLATGYTLAVDGVAGTVSIVD